MNDVRQTPARVLLVGNPNVGKTSLFNRLTGARHAVANYPGVTVEAREGWVRGASNIKLVDLPGIYSLTAVSDDEALALACIDSDASQAPTALLVIIDASNLARNLYLARTLLELGLPTVVALNMVDAARHRGMPVDVAALEQALGVKVVPTDAREGSGMDALRAALVHVVQNPTTPHPFAVEVTQACQQAPCEAPRAARLLCNAVAGREPSAVSPGERVWLDAMSASDRNAAVDAIVAARYRAIDDLLVRIQPADAHKGALDFTHRIDRVVTHRITGPLVFVGLMAAVFLAIFTGADPLMGAIEDTFAAISTAVQQMLGPGHFTDLLVNGVIAGVGNVLVFVPQIALLFLCLGLLEDSGYLARVAFLLDKGLRRFGLHGRAFIPLLSGYACAIPAILSTRTMSNWKDRLATMLMIPYMSCSARLPVYALATGAFFADGLGLISPSADQALILLGMYGLSTVSALLIGMLFRHTFLRGPMAPFVLELPPYRKPRWANTWILVWGRTTDFIRNAGTTILAITVVLWALLAFPQSKETPAQHGNAAIEQSYAGRLARKLDPVWHSIGQDWRVGVGIIGSFAAREVLVSTLGLVYGMENPEDPAPLREALAQARDGHTGKPRYSRASGLALMVFFVYACQCMSTLAVVRRETRGMRWPLFMLVSMTTLAYVAAALTYWLARACGYG